MSSFRKYGGLNYASTNNFTRSFISNSDQLNINKYEKLHFEIANQFARSAGGRSFDIIEFPDYFPIGNKIFSVLSVLCIRC